MNLYVVSFVYTQAKSKKLDLSVHTDRALFSFLEKNHELYIYSQDIKTLLNGIDKEISAYTLEQLEEYGLEDTFSCDNFNVSVFNADLIQHNVAIYQVV